MKTIYAGIGSWRQTLARLELNEFVVHRAMWASKNVLTYPFTVSTRGAWSGTEPVTVTVRDAKAVSSEYVCPPAECKQAKVPAADARPYDTVPNVFEFIYGLLNDSMSLPRVNYDKQFRFPTQHRERPHSNFR